MDSILVMTKNALGFFAWTVTELMVLFVGISFIVGVINEFVPGEKIQGMLSSRKGRGYIVGAGLGALTPFCSCSTIPITVGLLRAGAGFGPTMSFLFSSPLVNPVIVSLFFMAFGLNATLIYSIMALIMAISVSFLLEKFNFQRFVRNDVLVENIACCCTPPKSNPAAEPFPMAQNTGCCQTEIFPMAANDPAGILAAASGVGRWHRIFMESVMQFKHFLPYILIGVALGALAYGFVPEAFLLRYAGRDNILAVPFSAVIGVPLYVRVETMIPVAIALIDKGMSLGAVVALVIGGAGASIPEVVMLKRIFKLPMLSAFLLAIFWMAVGTGLVFNLMV